MRTAAFLISLFCLLLGGNVNLLAVTGSHSGPLSSTLHCKEQPQTVFTNIIQDKAFITNTSSPKEDQLLICEEVEDEEGSDISARKFKSPTGFNPDAQDHSVLTFYHHCAKPLPFIWRSVSTRYILQRTLRI